MRKSGPVSKFGAVEVTAVDVADVAAEVAAVDEPLNKSAVDLFNATFCPEHVGSEVPFFESIPFRPPAQW